MVRLMAEGQERPIFEDPHRVRPSSKQSPSRASKNVRKEEGEAPQAIANGSRRLQSKVGLQAGGKKSGATRLAG